VVYVAFVGHVNDGYKILIRNPKARKSLQRPRHRCKDNIKMDLKEIDTSEINTSGSGLRTSDGSPEHANEHYGSTKGWESPDQLSDY
jgi:hypothetical protein